MWARSVQRAANGFRSSFKAAVDEQNRPGMEAAMDAAIATTTTVMERELKLADAVLSDIGASMLNLESLNVAVTVNAGNVQPKNEKRVDEDDNSILRNGLGTLKNAIPSAVAKESIEAATKEATKYALQMTKEYIPSLMKGIGAKTIEKMAEGTAKTVGRVTPFIGPAIDTVTGIYDYYQAAKSQKAQEEALKRQAQALEDHIIKTTADLEAELHAACMGVLVPFFLPIERLLKEQNHKLNRDSQLAAAERDQLVLLKSRLIYLD